MRNEVQFEALRDSFALSRRTMSFLGGRACTSRVWILQEIVSLVSSGKYMASLDTSGIQVYRLH